MDKKFVVAAVASACLICIASCTREYMIDEIPEIPAYGSSNENRDGISVDKEFSSSSTVGDVISNPAFGDFGHLLFPVDRNVDVYKRQGLSRKLIFIDLIISIP